METQKVTKIVVIDDDPTGSQTVHSCLLLTRWDPATLMECILENIDEEQIFSYRIDL